MEYGFIKVCASSPKVKVADYIYNTEKVIEYIEKEYEKKSALIVFPELALSSASCGDLFYDDTLSIETLNYSLKKILKVSKDKKALIIVGAPFKYNYSLYNVALVINYGKLIAIVPNYNTSNKDINEEKYFSEYIGENKIIEVFGNKVLFGNKVIFSPKIYPSLKIAIEFNNDLYTPYSQSVDLAFAGANVVVNLSASAKKISSEDLKTSFVSCNSKRLISAYILADAGEGESSSEYVFSSNNIIAENGKVLAKSNGFKENSVRTEIDIDKLEKLRQKSEVFKNRSKGFDGIAYVDFDLTFDNYKNELERRIDSTPFIPSDKGILKTRCKEALDIQIFGLKKRLEHIGIENVILGVSGGLDSTLALLVAVNTFDLMGLDRKGIKAITMPAFGTSDRTKNNAKTLCELLGVYFEEINIKNAITSHLKDISYDINLEGVTFENSQARERTQILMDLANKFSGLVLGTGDLSELALGFATYNGDHMSMYGLNATVPKTFMRKMIEYYAIESENEELKKVLFDVIDTPVSPELLPLKDGELKQKTEELIGPYILHDFFLYNSIKNSFSPKKVYYLAKLAFKNIYTKEEILKYLKIFYKRFFANQFKRSCSPDGISIGSISLAPKSGYTIPSDASFRIWNEELRSIND